MRRLFVALPLPTDSVVFILSNNHINSIITAPLDFGDEDIVSQYISFMKMLSLTINERTIRFFHNEVLIFPLSSSRKTRTTPSRCSRSVPSSSTIPRAWCASP